ncbi:MAG TPA: signal peptidase II [Candidatus Sulfotelmatobacter sp.]|nr:signal peptidase II [Candidatus Sulfotelmatobacter sp.]
MKRVVALLAIAGGVLACDQWTKHLATAHLAGRPPVRLIGDYVQLTYALNSGVAFSLGAGSRFPFYLFSIAAALVILWLFARGRVPRQGQQFALALILGGALGNLVDRVSSGLVVDFVELGIGRFHWPVFNLADSAVTVGVALFILTGGSNPPARTVNASEPATLPSPGPLSSSDDLEDARSVGDAGARGGAVGPLPGDGAGRPLS